MVTPLTLCPSLSTWYAKEPTLSVAEARTMRTLEAGAVQKVVGCLQPSFHGRSISVTTFPCVYQAFYPTPQVLDQLLQSALSPIWGPRPQENSQDMWQMLRHSRINLTLAYLQDLLPGSVLKHQATPLLIQVDLFQATELETEAPALLPGAEAEKGPHLELDGTPVLFLPSLLALEPAAAPSAAPDPERVPSAAPAQVPGPELDSTGPRGLLGFPPQAPVTAAESAPVPEASHPCRVTGKKQPDGKPSLMAFSPREVAEQLTAIDAEVFKNVEPSECLGSTWGKRNRPGHENVAPTVWATVVQFNRVVKCVMTSCLGDPNVTARGRAKVLERWIEVARECRALRNISSLHAVLSALQSVPIHRLKKTWGKVSRKSCRKFKKLCDEDNSLSWELLIKSSLDEQEDGKQPSKFATLLRTLQRGRKRQQQHGIVPFLGTMLTDLIMLDTAMEDYVNVSEAGGQKGMTRLGLGKTQSQYQDLSDQNVVTSCHDSLPGSSVGWGSVPLLGMRERRLHVEPVPGPQAGEAAELPACRAAWALLEAREKSASKSGSTLMELSLPA
ncbi:ral guanine nucleotide dissociation stimulator-like isoform X1 [Equus asinus]|uniref:ral guanine nucleotide dissociation stimulator-like isoform X1 n=1 Tax=Equus asinus TaxID=9793 RepID=UPI0038F7A912